MQRIKIQVGDYILDTFKNLDEEFYLTESVYNINDLNSRNSSYSRTIEIPATDNNRKALDLQSNERLENPSFAAQLLVDNITFLSGNLYITRLLKHRIECIIAYSNFDLFDRIPNEDIGNISFSEYDFPFSVAGFVALAPNTSGPVLTYHHWIDEDSMFYEGALPPVEGEQDIKQSGFDFFQKDIFRKIIESVGYTYDDSAIADNDTYKNLLLAVPLPAFIQEDVPTGNQSEVSLNSNYSFIPVSSFDFGIVPWDNIISDPDSLYDPVNDEYVIATTGEYSIVCNYNIDYIQNIAGFGAVDLEVNGSSVDNFTTFLAGNGLSGSLSILQTFNAGDTIRVTVDCGYQNANRRDQIIVNSVSTFVLTQTNDPLTGDVIVSEWLPKINQRQFFADFCKFFNLMVFADDFNKSVKFKFFKDYINEPAEDFSNKIDINQDVANEISLPYYRKSEFAFTNDSLKRTDSNYIINLQDEALPPSGEILTINFSNSDNSIFQQSIPATQGLVTPFFRWSYSKLHELSITQNSSSFTLNVTNQIPQFQPGMYIMFGQSGIRNHIMRVSQRTGLGTGIFYNQYTGPTLSNEDAFLIEVSSNDLTPRHGIAFDPSISLALGVNANQLGFGTGAQVKEFRALNMTDIYNEFYANLFSALQTPKIIKCWMVFNTVELYNYLFENPVFIQELNGTYHINVIEQWKLNKPCLVELIRINTLI